jgi:hypothetical protein
MSAGRKINTQNQNWGTPPKYVRAVREFFDGSIDLDPCSNEHSVVNATVEYRLPSQDGLKETWNFEKIYVNPPYGADRERGTRIIHWLSRCAKAHERFSSQVLALVPVATNTLHWKKYVFPLAASITFLYDTRLKFLESGKDGGKGAPMSCAMVYWGTRSERFKATFSAFGAVVDLGSPDARMLSRTAIYAPRAARSTEVVAHQSSFLEPP